MPRSRAQGLGSLGFQSIGALVLAKTYTYIVSKPRLTWTSRSQVWFLSYLELQSNQIIGNLVRNYYCISGLRELIVGLHFTAEA